MWSSNQPRATGVDSPRPLWPARTRGTRAAHTCRSRTGWATMTSLPGGSLGRATRNVVSWRRGSDTREYREDRRGTRGFRSVRSMFLRRSGWTWDLHLRLLTAAVAQSHRVSSEQALRRTNDGPSAIPTLSVNNVHSRDGIESRGRWARRPLYHGRWCDGCSWWDTALVAQLRRRSSRGSARDAYPLQAPFRGRTGPLA